MKTEPTDIIRANHAAAGTASDDTIRLVGDGSEVTIKAAAKAEDGTAAPKARRLSIVAYNGGQFYQAWSMYPIVVELSGMDLGASGRPILIDHQTDLDSILGQTDEVKVAGGKLKASGGVFGKSDRCQRLLDLHDDGFKLQASIGARIVEREFIPEGSKGKANGKTFAGPVTIARKTVLSEISLVALGADDRTAATIAASQAGRKTQMTYEQWLEAKGIKAADQPAAVQDILKAQYAAEHPAKPADPPAPPAPPVKAGGLGGGTSSGGDPIADPVAGIRASAAAEVTRINAIRAACNGKHGDIEAKAIAENWDVTKAELEVLRAERPRSTDGGPAIHAHQKAATTDVIEAAVCRTLGVPDTEKRYKPETVEAADRYYKNIGLQQLLLIAAAANGYHAGPGARVHPGNLKDVLEAAFPVRATGFTTISLPTLLSNVANQELLAGFQEEDQTWREIAAVKPAKDFKTTRSVRLLDDGEYEELAPDGRIAHGKLGEQSFERTVKTHAKMYGLTRTDIVNDDLGAFEDMRDRVGRGGAKKLNTVFWRTFMDNALLFTADNGNYLTGAGTPLGVDGAGLQLGITAYRKMRSPAADGAKRLNTGRPAIVLVPPELQFVAERLYTQTTIVENVANANIHAGKYKPVVSDWLSDPNFTGYSSLAWYLLRAPTSAAAAVVVSFLNGVQTPTVESAQADFDQLGVQFRGYFDFGVDLFEPTAGLKVKGAA